MVRVTDGSRRTINDILAESRSHLARISPHQAWTESRAGALILDTRQDTARWAAGGVAGALHTPRTVLEWVVDPASGHQDPRIVGFDQVLIVMCEEGYSSSLAARTLQVLGFRNATDMIGGFAGWQDAGLPVRAIEPEIPCAPPRPSFDELLESEIS